MPTRYFNTKRTWNILAFLAALIGAGAVFLLEVFSAGGDHAPVRATAFDVAGPSVFIVIAIPLLLTVIPLFFTGRPWVIVGYISAVAMIIYTVTGILSIGLFFLPATVVAVIAAFVRPPTGEVLT